MQVHVFANCRSYTPQFKRMDAIDCTVFFCVLCNWISLEKLSRFEVKMQEVTKQSESGLRDLAKKL